MLRFAKVILLTSLVSIASLQSVNLNPQSFGAPDSSDAGKGRNLLDWVGLGTGPETDPYIAKTNAACLTGDLAECFKSRALTSFDDFFNQGHHQLTEYANILPMPRTQLRQLNQEPFEFSEAPRSEESEWDQLVKFALRKAEKFMKSTALQIELDNEVTEAGRYSPRVIDEIVDDIDAVEDRKDKFFKKKQLKKLFIPMLLLLKLFKVKLLLFLPLILGLAAFKKLLSFVAIIVPGLIAFFKFCKPNFPQNYYNNQYSGGPVGIGFGSHYREQPTTIQEYSDNSYYGNYGHGNNYDHHHAQHVAYNGWSQYRNNGKNGDIKAEVEDKPKKSILPDS